MKFYRMPIELESPEERGYASVRYNLAESSVPDLPLGALIVPALDKLFLRYSDHRGIPELRSCIAQDAGLADPDAVLVTAGAAAALFIVHAVLLSPGDHAVVVFPNYGTNLETPKTLGAEVTRLELQADQGWKISIAELASLLRPETKLISITTPHNPSGTFLSREELYLISELAAHHGCRLLVDETYSALAGDEKLPAAASLGAHVISVSSLSKAYGVPGIRTGWILCTDQQLREEFLAAKEQIMLCNSVLDETVALSVLQQREVLLPKVLRNITRKRNVLLEWLRQHDAYFETVMPQAGVVCFPRIRNEKANTALFYQTLEEKGVLVGRGGWFGMDERYFRIGYGWPAEADLQTGLSLIAEAVRTCI